MIKPQKGSEQSVAEKQTPILITRIGVPILKVPSMKTGATNRGPENGHTWGASALPAPQLPEGNRRL